jgi:RNA polymerase sigma-70 factor, ECF subfamily
LETLGAGEAGVREVDASGEEDALLAQALIDGNKEAALSAWRRFSPLVYRTLRRMLGPGVDLQDLTQEVFLRFFGKVKELKKRESLRAFVMAIAIRRAQEEIKRRRVRRWFAPLLGDAMMRPTTTEMDPEAREAIVHLYDTIDRLNVRDRTIYILRFVEGLEQAEISAAIGVSVSTVRRRLERLTKRVNSLMNSDPVLSQYLARRRSDGSERPTRRTVEAPVEAQTEEIAPPEGEGEGDEADGEAEPSAES